jgi:hypothetical protein
MVPFAFLAILYRSKSYVTVPESSQWQSKPAELEIEHEQAQAEPVLPEGRAGSSQTLTIETDLYKKSPWWTKA